MIYTHLKRIGDGEEVGKHDCLTTDVEHTQHPGQAKETDQTHGHTDPKPDNKYFRLIYIIQLQVLRCIGRS